MIKEINQGIFILIDKSSLDLQISEQKLEDIIEIRFYFASSYRNQSLSAISLELTNKSSTHSIYVNWQYSTFTDAYKQSQRLFYHVPGLTIDFFQPQVFTVIAAEQTLNARIVTQSCLSRDEETGELTIQYPIFNWQELNMNRSFYLYLVFQVSEPIYKTQEINLNTLKCKFNIKKIPWQEVIYWN